MEVLRLSSLMMNGLQLSIVRLIKEVSRVIDKFNRGRNLSGLGKKNSISLCHSSLEFLWHKVKDQSAVQIELLQICLYYRL